MADLVFRFLNLLVRFGIVSNPYKVTYSGAFPSFNDIYESKHWRIRYNLTQKYHKIFAILIKQAQVPKITEFSLILSFNSRHDVDNLIAMEKFFTDTLVETGRIEKDNKKVFKSLYIVYNNKLPVNQIDFFIIPHKQNGD